MDFETLQADTVNHAIEGYLHTGEHINIPLISHVIDNLYVGGCVQDVDLGDYFTHVFSMYPWERYKGSHELVETKMYDSRDAVDVETVDAVSNAVLSALLDGGNVLVHCQAGINRSNLIAATVLIKLGYTPERAIALLREKRSPQVLANPTFEQFLLEG